MSGRRRFQVFFGLLCMVLVSIQIYNDRRYTNSVKTKFLSQDSENGPKRNDSDKIIDAQNASRAAGGTKEELDAMAQKLAIEEKIKENPVFERERVTVSNLRTSSKNNESSDIATAPAPTTTTTPTTAPKRTTTTTTPTTTQDRPTDHSKKKVFVCITGQLQRLILRRKKTHFFQPILDAGYEIDLALVVTTGKARFTNAWGKTDESLWKSYEQAASYLNQIQGVHVLPRPNFTITEEPDVPIQYLKNLDKENRTLGAKMLRVRNHARQFEQWTHCYHPFLQNMTNTTSSYPYKAIMRFRDDMAFYPKFKFTDTMKVLAALQYERTMVTCDCRYWGGINDRFVLATPDIAKELFLGPHARFSTAIARNDTFTGIHNPETFLYSTYKQLKIKVVVSSTLRFVKKYIFNTTIGDSTLGAKEELPHCPYASLRSRLNPKNADWYYPDNILIDDFLKKNNLLNTKPSWWPYEL